jgi:hypothetical protein
MKIKANSKCNFCKKKRCDCNKPVIDMIDETKGYVEGNVRWISTRAARLKATLARVGTDPDDAASWKAVCEEYPSVALQIMADAGIVKITECAIPPSVMELLQPDHPALTIFCDMRRVGASIKEENVSDAEWQQILSELPPEERPHPPHLEGELWETYKKGFAMARRDKAYREALEKGQIN